MAAQVHADFGLFVTPPFEGAMAFPWINKPSSIDYFTAHAPPSEYLQLHTWQPILAVHRWRLQLHTWQPISRLAVHR